MTEQGSERFRSMSHGDAVALLRKRLMTIGAVLGVIMGVIWIIVALLAVPGFPEFGSAPFLVIFFLSVIILGAAGLFAGYRVWRKNVPETGA